MQNIATSTAASEQQSLWRPALALFIFLSFITGLVYPLLVTAIAQAIFPDSANGSLIKDDGIVVGSRLIGQSFSDPKYFWGRPSATAPMAYNAAASGGSNLGPSNPALIDAVRTRIESLHRLDPANTAPIPVDLVTASASGLDPDISLAGANYQIARVARSRGLREADVRALVEHYAQTPWLDFLGEPRINVLELNLALDAAMMHKTMRADMM